VASVGTLRRVDVRPRSGGEQQHGGQAQDEGQGCFYGPILWRPEDAASGK
jgi:hypothetical protein